MLIHRRTWKIEFWILEMHNTDIDQSQHTQHTCYFIIPLSNDKFNSIEAYRKLLSGDRKCYLKVHIFKTFPGVAVESPIVIRVRIPPTVAHTHPTSVPPFHPWCDERHPTKHWLRFLIYVHFRMKRFIIIFSGGHRDYEYVQSQDVRQAL